MNKKEKKLDGCMVSHIFEYKPDQTEVMMKEFLCDCEKCLQLCFDECCREENQNNDSQLEFETEDDCHLDEDNGDSGLQIFEFVTIPSFVSVITYYFCEPVYIIKVTEKGVASGEMKDRYGHSIASGKLYLKKFSLIAENM